MKTFIMNDKNIPAVAKLMEAIKPEWWSYEGALKQLSDARNNIGWLIGDDEHNPKGWLLCSDDDYALFLNLECMGFDDAGSFSTGEQLQALFEKAEAYARSKKYPVLRYMIGTSEMSSFQKQELSEYWRQALDEIKSIDVSTDDFLFKFGFRPTGFIPNCYGDGHHAVILIKTLRRITQ